MAKSKTKFTEKEQRFIDEYLRCLNGAEAARRAGYSKESAREIASQNLTKLHISEEIERRKKLLQEEIKADRDRIMRETALIAFSRPKHYMKWTANDVELFESEDLDFDKDAAIKKIKKTETEFGTNLEVEFHSKEAALGLLAKLTGADDGSSGADTEFDEGEVSTILEEFKK